MKIITKDNIIATIVSLITAFGFAYLFVSLDTIKDANANEQTTNFNPALKYSIAEITIKNPFGVGFTLEIDCRPLSERGSTTRANPGKKLRSRYLAPRSTIVLMIDNPHCEITPKL